MSDVRRIDISEDLAAAIAAVVVPDTLVAFNGHPVRTVGALLEADEAISAQIRNLSQNPLIALALNTMFADVRGGKSATLVVSSGKLMADVMVAIKPHQGRGRSAVTTAVTNPTITATVDTNSKSTATIDTNSTDTDTQRGPSLEYLRARAGILGVDISDLGRKKGLIVARLEKATSGQIIPESVSSESVSSESVSIDQYI